MPKEIKLSKNIPKLFCRNQYQSMLIVWVAACRRIMPNYPIKLSVREFLKNYEIPEDFWNEQSAEIFVYNSLGDDLSMNYDNLLKTINNYGKNENDNR